MATTIKKITVAEMDENGVCAAPDILTGTPAENKAVFDNLVRQVVAPAYNACAEAVDAINSQQVAWSAAEDGREEAETDRTEAETDREAAEAVRAEAENARGNAEDARAAAEAARAAAESARSAAETARAAAE